MGISFHLRRQFLRLVIALQRFEDEHGDRFGVQLAGVICLWVTFYFFFSITG